MYQISIEFLRVQTFLFAVPRLRNMVGANVLVGEMIRLHLPKLLEGAHKSSTRKFKVCQLEVPSNLCFISPCKDPLDEAIANVLDKDKDNPADLYKRGILRRDGGHFSVLFAQEEEAKAFQQAARNLLLQNLPGLRFEIRFNEFGVKSENKPVAITRQLIDLPQFQVCQISGNGPASYIGDKGKSDSESPYISESAYKAQKEGLHFSQTLKGEYQNRTRDMVSLISPTLPLRDIEVPKDFQELCGNDYMAVIHADGNSIGNRYKEYKKNQMPDGLSDLHKEMHGEKFYYSMRVAVRAALKQALNDTFQEPTNFTHRPYQILMLGGDDLLMVCRAKQAFDFIIAYAQALTETDKMLADRKPLTIGVGMVISSPNVPFYHLHHLAENLASSAKQLFGSQPDEQKTSVVDWIISTHTTIDDPIAWRRKNSLVHYQVNNQQETLRLHNKPYPILGDDSDLNTLKGLWEQAQRLDSKIKNQKAARSQLRQLVFDLGQGRRWADLAVLGLPKKTREALENVKVLTDNSLWQTDEPDKIDKTCYTALADLMELYEVNNLQREER